MMVGPGIKTGLKIHYRDPKEVGADRIVAAMAAFKKYGGPLIIIDFGTGTTYDVVSKDGDYLGGAIAPGMGISVEALYERAARLQRVELKAPPTVLGRTTAESMQAGIILRFTAQGGGVGTRTSWRKRRGWWPTPGQTLSTSIWAARYRRSSRRRAVRRCFAIPTEPVGWRRRSSRRFRFRSRSKSGWAGISRAGTTSRWQPGWRPRASRDWPSLVVRVRSGTS